MDIVWWFRGGTLLVKIPGVFLGLFVFTEVPEQRSSELRSAPAGALVVQDLANISKPWCLRKFCLDHLLPVDSNFTIRGASNTDTKPRAGNSTLVQPSVYEPKISRDDCYLSQQYECTEGISHQSKITSTIHKENSSTSVYFGIPQSQREKNVFMMSMFKMFPSNMNNFPSSSNLTWPIITPDLHWILHIDYKYTNFHNVPASLSLFCVPQWFYGNYRNLLLLVTEQQERDIPHAAANEIPIFVYWSECMFCKSAVTGKGQVVQMMMNPQTNIKVSPERL